MPNITIKDFKKTVETDNEIIRYQLKGLIGGDNCIIESLMDESFVVKIYEDNDEERLNWERAWTLNEALEKVNNHFKGWFLENPKKTKITKKEELNQLALQIKTFKSLSNITLKKDFKKIKEAPNLFYYEFRKMIGCLNCTISPDHDSFLVQFFEGEGRRVLNHVKTKSLRQALKKVNQYFGVWFFEHPPKDN